MNPLKENNKWITALGSWIQLKKTTREKSKINRCNPSKKIGETKRSDSWTPLKNKQPVNNQKVIGETKRSDLMNAAEKKTTSE